MLRDIWKNFNVSLVMVLPIFWKITDDIFSKKENIKYPFSQLVFEYGLLNTFLFRNQKFTGELYLLFDKQKFTNNLGITRSKYFSMCELLLDSEYINTCELYNDYVLIGLKIPKKYHEDIGAIIRGKYTETSKEYKDELYLKKRLTYIPDSVNEIGRYIIINDLAFAISIRSPHIKEELESVIGEVKGSVKEYYQDFNKDKENFVPQIVESSKELLKYAQCR